MSVMNGQSPKPRERLSAAEARRIAVAAQGFGRPGPPVADGGPIRRLIRRLGVVQIDSVNVLVRSHYLPLFARLGPYATALLDQAAYDGRRRYLFEYWGHEASFLPVEHYRLFRWRMEAAGRLERVWPNIAETHREKSALIERVLAHVTARGPTSASEIEDCGPRSGPWWGWSEGKKALEYLFWTGQVTTASRRNFERLYDLPARVLPAAAMNAPVPSREDAQRELVMIAARAMGVATETDLRDYFRLPPRDSRARVAELVESGALAPVAVEGWAEPAYLDPGARMPRRIETNALLSPFDSLVWARARTERLWGFRYRIEIYTPTPKRLYGYYVLPYLLDGMLVGRIDLKADRAARKLRVIAAHGEPGAAPEAIAPPLLAALGRMAAWLGLDGIVIEPKGNIADTIRRRHATPGGIAAGGFER